MKYLMLTIGLALTLLVAGCGDDGESSDGDDDTTATDAPQATDPPATDPPATDPAAVLPTFTQFEVSDSAACPAPDVSVPPNPREVTITWAVEAADSVYVAIDNVDGPFELGLAATGSITVPNACPGPHTFFVVAENADGRAVMEATR